MNLFDGTFCFLFCFTAPADAAIRRPSIFTDSYCSTYQQAVRTKEDVAAVKALPRDVQRRIQGNDLDYLCNCKGWKDASCQQKRTAGE